jgi:hypothetical protein
MGLENLSPNIKKRAKAKKDKGTKADPPSHVVEGHPAHMVIAGYDKTFCLCLTTFLQLAGADIRRSRLHVFGIEFIALSKPTGFLHEVCLIDLLNVASKIVRRLGRHYGLSIPFSWERREGALDGKGEVEKRALARNEESNYSR